MANIELYDYQIEAIDKLRNGSILCGGVGSGKSRTSLAYFFIKVCKGSIMINGEGYNYYPIYPRDLYIITTAKKRDSKEWEKECSEFGLSTNQDISISKIKVIIDSWNNIKKYKDVVGAFFIFDEQRVVGRGAWVKAFLQITRKNKWILASATPGDKWEDYIPVFVANGFYNNVTQFRRMHCVYSRYSKYPKVEKYLNEQQLKKLRNHILIHMKDQRISIRHKEDVICEYDKELYRTIFRNRWDPYENKPIEETGKLFYLMRKVTNSHESRLHNALRLIKTHERVIIFYNHTYELELLKELCTKEGIVYSEWNGLRHEELPTGNAWVYLVQYTAGCEGWNCIETNTIIFFSQSYSYRQTEQAAGRIDRINTPYKDLYYYYFRSHSPIDIAIHRALKAKKNFNESSFKL